MQKIEAQLTTKWKKWAIHNTKSNFIAEIKWCPTGRLNFKSGSFDKERKLLLMAKHNSLIHKQSDIAMMGTLCDVWGLYQCEAWVVLFFNKKIFYMIDIDTVQGMIDDGHKSITEAEACALASHSGMLK